MNDFKEGDEIWFFWTFRNSNFWGEDENTVFPKSLNIEKGNIVYINENKDTVHVYVRGCEGLVCKFGYCFLNEYIFKTKKDALDAMKKEIRRLEDE